MRYNRYKFKFYLNASHAIYIDGAMGERHPHTWEIAIMIQIKREEFVTFSNIEQKIDKWLSKFQDNFLNEIPPFDMLNPTLENCCDYFKEKLNEILERDGWRLLSIELSETPTRSYLVNQVNEDVQSAGRSNADAVADGIIEKLLNRFKEES